MKILIPPPTDNQNYRLPPEALREFLALRATAINPETCPILARHWPGVLLIGDQLCCDDNSPLVQKFETMPVVEIKEPNRRRDFADRVLASVSPDTTDRAA